jgi:putative transposase
MTDGNSPIDRSKLGQAKRHILTDKNGISISVILTSASMHDIKAVTAVIDNAVIKRPVIALLSTTKERKRRKQHQHLCLDRAYNSKSIIQQISKRGYVLHIPYKRKRRHKEREMTSQKSCQTAKNKRWVVSERTNSWHNRFRKLFIRYEKKVENYLGLVQFSCSIIIYRKIILG